ncbi:MAG: DUF1569 domain-containing protein [Bacteroidota bacterium]
MEVKSLFDSNSKLEIINRINTLTPQSAAVWGKMNVAQMLAHCQMPLGVATGDHKFKGSFLLKLIGPMFKPLLYNEKPFKRNLGTDKSFIMTGTQKDFAVEKQKLVDMVQRFNENNMTDAPHPIFGRMTKEQWSKGTWKHLDHHLQQFGV